MTQHVIASASGLMFGFVFFLALSGAIGFIIYALLTKPSVRRSGLGEWTVPRPFAITLAALISTAVLSAIYVGSIAGFHAVTVGDRDVRMDYALARRSTTLSYAEIKQVVRRPTYKAQWRLEIHTLAGRKLESAAGGYESVGKAAEAVEQRLTR